MSIEREAEKHIIRDNYNIQCLLGEQQLKQVLVEMFMAGYKYKEAEEPVEEDPEDRLFEMIESIKVKNL